MENKELMTVKDVQKYLGFGRDKTYALFRLRDFPAIRFNNTAVVYKSDLEEWLKAHRGLRINL